MKKREGVKRRAAPVAGRAEQAEQSRAEQGKEGRGGRGGGDSRLKDKHTHRLSERRPLSRAMPRRRAADPLRPRRCVPRSGNQQDFCVRWRCCAAALWVFTTLFRRLQGFQVLSTSKNSIKIHHRKPQKRVPIWSLSQTHRRGWARRFEHIHPRGPYIHGEPGHSSYLGWAALRRITITRRLRGCSSALAKEAKVRVHRKKFVL